MRQHTCSEVVLLTYRSSLTISRFSRLFSHPLRTYCATIAGYGVLTLVKVGASGKLKSNITTSTLLWTVAGSIVNFTW